jgi:hypothetical protein
MYSYPLSSISRQGNSEKIPHSSICANNLPFVKNTQIKRM